MKAGPLDSARTVAIIDQTATALSAAHAHGLIHRDIKPADILIDHGAGRDGTDHVYLSDFGVAKQIASPGLTTTGTFVGTADYASPEQIEGKPLDGRADVYSLGCVVYECLTGTNAYDKDSEVALMYAHLLEPPPAVTDKRPDLPPAINEVIAKAMAKAKEDRYQTPTELSTALARVFDRRDLVVAPGRGRSDHRPRSQSWRAKRGYGAAAGGRRAIPQRGHRRSTRPHPSARAEEPTWRPHCRTGSPGPRVARRSGGRRAQPDRGRQRNRRRNSRHGGPRLRDDADRDRNDTDGGRRDGWTLLGVLVPTQIAKTCSTQPGTGGALEADVCRASKDAPTSDPDELDLTFYRDARTLAAAYEDAQRGVKLSRCGAAGGESVWIHPTTGKIGGRRVCFIDSEGRFAILWTHEKRGSEDHVDMLGIAREPGRSPGNHDLVAEPQRLPRQVSCASSGAHVLCDDQGCSGQGLG